MALVWVTLGLAACESELVTLGQLAEADPNSGSAGSPAGGATSKPRLRFGDPVQRTELGSGEKDDNPTLTADALTVYFSSERRDETRVYTATRPSVDEPFGEPALVDLVGNDEDISSPAISSDGLTLWVGKDRGEDLETDIWVTTRTPTEGFGPLENVTNLNSVEKDIPRPPAGGGLVMPLSSQRAGADLDYRIYLATRRDDRSPFGAPQPLPELDLGRRVVDGFLTEDLLTVFFSSGFAENDGELFMAQRPSVTLPFDAPVPIEALNRAETDERDPWLSKDGTRFFFTSDRVAGDHEIFECVVSRE